MLAHKELGRGGGEIPEDIQIGYQSEVPLQEERSLLIDRGCEDGMRPLHFNYLPNCDSIRIPVQISPCHSAIATVTGSMLWGDVSMST